MAVDSTLIARFIEEISGPEPSTKSLEEDFIAPLQEQLVNNGGFFTPLSYYLDILKNTNAFLIKYMSEEDKSKLRRHLQITYLLLLVQKKHEFDMKDSRKQNKYYKKINQCIRLLDLLDPKKDSQSEAQKNLSPEQIVKYLGLGLGKEVAQKTVDWINGKTSELDKKSGELIDKMNWINERRLYWVWGSSFIKIILDVLPPDFFNVTKTSNLMHAPDPYTGILSWSLYYFRFAVHLNLFLKHTIAGPWMSAEERKIPWKKRFWTQWDLRKFALLNDSLWATCNLACFFWLTAQTGLGPWGDVFTLGLLCFDLGASLWSFREQRTEYNAQTERYKNQIRILEAKIFDVLHHNPDLAEELKSLRVKEYRLQIYDLQQAKNQLDKEWHYKVLTLKNDSAYAIGLIIAFALLTLPFLPYTGPAILAVSITGAVLCFVFSVIYNAVTAGLEISKTKDFVKESERDYFIKIKAFQDLLREHPKEDTKLRFLFMEIKQAQAETHFQEQKVVYQTMHFYRKVIMQTLMPALILVSLVFLPFGVGLPIIGMALVMAIATNKMIEDIYKTKKAKPDFPEAEYQQLLLTPTMLDKKPVAHKNIFFDRLVGTNEKDPLPKPVSDM